MDSRTSRRAFQFLFAVFCLTFAILAPQAVRAQAAQAGAAASNEGSRIAGADYVLSPGDVIKINVFQNPDLSVETRVSDSGAVSYPLLNSVKLGGLTLGQAEKRVADGLRSGNFVKQPQVSIMVLQVRGNQASILGQVNKPGRYPLEQANTKLSDLLALAGGVAPTGSDVAVVSGTRGGRPFRQEVDIPQVLSGRSKDDLTIQGGDVVFVDRSPMVYIYGEVQKPGAVRLERGMTVQQALAAGGGLTLRGTQRGLVVTRKAGDGQTQSLEPKMSDTLRDGDVIHVKESLF